MTDIRAGLRAIPLFADLGNDDLDLLAAGSYVEEAAAGTVLFEEGDAGDRACVITDGEVEILKTAGTRQVLLAVRNPGDVIGEMALLDSAPRMATVRAKSDSTFITIPKQQMDDLLSTSATAARSLFGVLLSRWRETESQLRQSERMAQIGTLTAGLAHEMNNPAAAVRRGSARLGDALERLVDRIGELRAADLDAASTAHIDGLLDAMRRTRQPLGAIERADLEDEFEVALDSLGISDAWRMAPILTDAEITPEAVQTALGEMDPEVAGLAVGAMCVVAETTALAREVEEGAERLSAIVGAMKSYAYLDQPDVQQLDVRQGIDDTLLILKHKLAGIDVVREYPDGPVSIEAYAGALNQVWTNLIDNAADALTTADVPNPRIEIRITSVEAGVVVEVEDNGPGIPPEIVGRIFDAFFTTKPPGSGTGLGLDLVYGTVVHRHGGDITVESGPGKTVFRVELPVRQD